MRYGSDDTIYAFEGRLHNFGGWRLKTPLRYSTWLAILGPLVIAVPILFVFNAAVFLATGSQPTWFLFAVSLALAIPGALFIAGACAAWLMQQVKKDRGLRGVLECYRHEINTWWRLLRAKPDPELVVVRASRIRRREVAR